MSQFYDGKVNWEHVVLWGGISVKKYAVQIDLHFDWHIVLTLQVDLHFDLCSICKCADSANRSTPSSAALRSASCAESANQCAVESICIFTMIPQQIGCAAVFHECSCLEMVVTSLGRHLPLYTGVYVVLLCVMAHCKGGQPQVYVLRPGRCNILGDIHTDGNID